MVPRWAVGDRFHRFLRPVEIAYFDRGPIDAEELVLGGYWSTYWYRGYIYGTEIVRGLDVFALTPSQFLSEAEIAAAELADVGDVFTLSNSFLCSGPRSRSWRGRTSISLSVAGELSESLGARLAAALDRSESQLQDGGSDEDLAAGLETLAAAVDDSRGDGLAGRREARLSQTLRGIAAKLR